MGEGLKEIGKCNVLMKYAATEYGCQKKIERNVKGTREVAFF